ncbi:hypothetical protein K443DRAFT_130617 [Laccaria amethystina LaAM-08-1]|uniref:Unplaced genomic scaffold K443scaffold_31, whole genome shotgun sequence n=1 Tax=Laccaria amethystina LaAM-08-1 TaxID=1095629 RepID=A0A0C9XIK0_9AGAR|nr:hypothetical protein K443DRAFT_130617 [Laccaria amethystina LaAM-08-1]
MSIAATSLFQVEEGYFGSISVVSRADGSHLGTKTFSLPSASRLTEAVDSVLSQFPSEGMSHFTSVGLADDDDIWNVGDSLNSINHSIARRTGSPNPYNQYILSHGEAYCGVLPPDSKSILNVMFLDFSPNRIASETFVSIYDEGYRKTKPILAVFVCEPPLHCIVLNNPPASMTPVLHAILSENYPNIPVLVVSASDISQAVIARYQYLKSRITWQFDSILRNVRYDPPPIRIASSTGVAVPLINCARPSRRGRIFTTSVDDQATATVRMLFGNHPLAKDNVERGVVTLEGLKPMPKDVACIKVFVDFLDDEFVSMAIVTVMQYANNEKTHLPLVSKTAILPHFLFDITRHGGRYHYGLEHQYDGAQPELPE